MGVSERFGQRSLLRSYPTRDGSHRTKRAPRAWRIDKIEDNADNGGDDDDGPEYAANIAPHSQSSLAPAGLAQLDTEHRKNEEHHEQSETESTHKRRYRLVR